ncbi:caspase-1 [Anabrus simplex]|uniref:caspase-1 n=1 Tax=Anabrus simplex TaxID=316456 RepID=UPI0034DD00F7
MNMMGDVMDVTSTNSVVPDDMDGKSMKASGDADDSRGSGLLNGNETLFAKMPVAMDARYYNMDHRRRGLAVIFNHEHFDIRTLKPRSGTRVDRDNLQESLKYLGFEVSVHNDLNFKDITKVIEEVAEADHSDCDSFVMAVLSHGELGILYARDAPYKAESLWARFSADKCPQLAGKPKLFFIQACQGDRLDPGVTLRRTETDGNPVSYKIPTQADFLIAYSTVPGYYSWRNTTNGSWFMQALCYELKRHGFSLDILTLMTFVNQHVAIDFESNSPQSPTMHNQKQIPCITTMLTRLLLFSEKQK